MAQSGLRRRLLQGFCTGRAGAKYQRRDSGRLRVRLQVGNHHHPLALAVAGFARLAKAKARVYASGGLVIRPHLQFHSADPLPAQELQPRLNQLPADPPPLGAWGHGHG